MFAKLNTTAATLALAVAASFGAGAVSAQGFSPAQLQLSAQAGVEPGVFTVGQLNALIDAERSDRTSADPAQLARSFLMEKDAGAIKAGDDQLSAQAGVEPGKFTTGQLHTLLKAERSGDPEARALLIDAYTRENTGRNAGLEQLAARAGITTEGHSPAEIAAAYIAATTSLD